MHQSNAAIPAGLERRLEDYKLITGGAHYVDDLRSPQGRPAALHMVAVRSPYAHAQIGQIDLAPALALPGVVAAFSGAELASNMRAIDTAPVPGLKKPDRRPLAIGRARYVGDPVAVVLAEDRYIARDASELVSIDYEPLPAIVDPEDALVDGAPLLYDELETNAAYQTTLQGGDIAAAFEQADHTLRLRLVNQRISPASLETRACLFDFDASSGEFSAWLSSQSIYRAQQRLANYLNLDPQRIHIYNAEVGGGFGAKNSFLGEEIIAATLAIRLGRPIKWIEDRSENLLAQIHGRGQINYVEAAFKHDGRLLGLKVRTVGDFGAFLSEITQVMPISTLRQLSGPYRVQAIDGEVIGALTNKVPTNAYRGAGRPEATYILERVMDRIAHELGLDPAEVRRRNFIAPDAFPYTTPTGLRYDSGNYPATLERALELCDYAGWREQQRERRGAGSSRLLGIGLSSFVEISGGVIPGPLQESATVRICNDGTILVQCGVATNGQGHFTLFTQLAAEVFHMSPAKIAVQMNDTALPAFSFGTFASRITQTSGPAIRLAAEAVREKAILLASRLLEAAPADLVLENGQIAVRGVPTRAVALGELAHMVEEQPTLIEREAPNPANGVPIEGLAAWRKFEPADATFSSGTHIAIVEIDSETGELHLPAYIAVDDCGRVLNHYLTEAQIHGSIAQGIGQALYEELPYSVDGQPLASTLMDYTLPIAGQIPSFVTATIETPSPTNPLGVKGAGEAGCLAAPPAIVNAVLDALAPLGITTIDMPLRPEKIWQLIQLAHQGKRTATNPPPPPTDF